VDSVRNFFFGNSGGNTKQTTSTVTSQPELNTSPRSLSGNMGSVAQTTPYGSSIKYTGPNAAIDFPKGGSVNPLGSLEGEFALNQRTSIGVGISPFSKSTTLEGSDNNGVSKRALNIPFTPFSLFKTTYQGGNPEWNKTSDNQSALHLNSELLKSKELELKSIESNRKMTPEVDYLSQRNSTMEQISSIKLDTEKRSQTSSSTFSFFK
jgi:hypothetical protein